MANNRIFIVCDRCNSRFHLAKGYPQHGYYAKHDDGELDEWFASHQWCSDDEDDYQLGMPTYFSLRYEHGPGGYDIDYATGRWRMVEEGHGHH